MRLAFILTLTLLMLASCGKKPNMVESLPDSDYPRHYPAHEVAP